MKGLKFLAACAAVGAVSVACAVSSLAADPTYQLTVSEYNATNGTIDITVPAEYTALVGSGDYTLLVLSDDATSITEANKDIVKQIQQGDSTILTGVKVGTITPTEADQTFYVRVGGADADANTNPTGYAAGTFVVKGTGSDSPYTDPTHLVGDVNGSTTLDTGDLADLVYYFAGTYTLTGDNYQAADVNDSQTVDTGDLADLVYYFAGTYKLPATTLAGKTNVVPVE